MMKSEEIMMKRIIFGNMLKKTEVFLSNVSEETPIFSRKNGVMNGFVCQDGNKEYAWVHRIGGCLGACGYYETREKCIRKSQDRGDEFFIDQGGTHKKIILEKHTDIIHHDCVATNTPIFVVKEHSDKIAGMVFFNKTIDAWALLLGGRFLSNGYWDSREEAMKNTGSIKYNFFIDVEI